MEDTLLPYKLEGLLTFPQFPCRRPTLKRMAWENQEGEEEEPSYYWLFNNFNRCFWDWTNPQHSR